LEEIKYQRKIRSFVKRAGRLTAGQQRALDELLPRFGIDQYPGLVNFETLFSSKGDTILEIGFGMGQSLLQQAQANALNNYLGIEVHSPGVGSLLNGMKEQQLDNIRVSMNDAVEVLEKNIPEKSLNVVQLFFPDPWHKYQTSSQASSGSKGFCRGDFETSETRRTVSSGHRLGKLC